ncbi:mitochondrial 18 KDa protein-domain-containing protein [Phakopsora pachyrhizi]|nr:mitochondrial 18 KDa protein-domain-containing protein [Phakopsora pachyrhizi]
MGTPNDKLPQLIADGRIDTTETPARYLGLVARIRPLLIPATRYLAYTSDVGEAFRPIINPKLVTATYGISIGYVIGDVAYEGWKGHLQAKGDPEDKYVIGLKVARRAVFQGTASMLFPAITIHSAVKYSDRLVFSKFKNPGIRSIGPTSIGLGLIPFLPSIFDEPLEHLINKTFDGFEKDILGRIVPERSDQKKS